MSTGVARIIARSRKRGEARYGMVGKEEEPNDGRRRLADWLVGRGEKKGEKRQKKKKKKEVRKEAAR